MIDFYETKAYKRLKVLKQLITDNTDILELRDTLKISDIEKVKLLGLSSDYVNKVAKGNYYDILGFPCCTIEKFIDSMYLYHDNLYYFKEDLYKGDYKFRFAEDYKFEFADNLMGSYLAKKIGIRAVDYYVARVGNAFGLASQSFKEEKFDYYYLDYFDGLRDIIRVQLGDFNIDTIGDYENIFRKYELNESVFINHILEMIALDVYTLKRCRNLADIQIQINKETGDIDLAPLYDFSKCNSEIIFDYGARLGLSKYSFTSNHFLLEIDVSMISLLINKYPYFYECLLRLMDQGMSTTWENICIDNNFNQDSYIYYKILQYYKIKEEKQNKLLNKIFKKDLPPYVNFH